MKNFYLNKTNKIFSLTNKIAFLVILSMLFQLLSPAIVYGEASSTDETSNETEVTTEIKTGDATSGLTNDNEINSNTTDTDENDTKDDTESEDDTATDTKDTEEDDTDSEEDTKETKKTDNDTTNNATGTPDKSDQDDSDDKETASSTKDTKVDDKSSTSNSTSSPETTHSTTTSTSSSFSDVATSTANTATSTNNATSTATSTDKTKTSQPKTDNASSTKKATSTATSTSTNNKEDSSESDSDFSFKSSNITSTNTATSTNNATSTASSGNNTVESGDFVTETGDAVSYVDLTNMVNTNIVNSVGLIDFIREVLGYQNFDLRDVFADIFTNFDTAETTSACENECDMSSLFVDLVNQANIENNVSVTANSGNNNATGTGAINTGDAYASSNIVNLANTNVVDSNYLLLVFDNFADLSGSLVLPNSDFFSTLFQQKSGSGGSFNFNNSATVNNSATTTANTGNNSATGDDNTINTGNSVSSNSTTNLINQNLLNTNNFSMLVKVHGDWSGEVFGLPEGMQWEDTGSGIRLFYESDKVDNNNQETLANVTNDANISNDVSVFALTGDNNIAGSGKNTINTGDAYANSTIVNIGNTNVVGSNWINLIFNIYGDWSGNLAFGQPDLWLGLKAKTENKKLFPGNDIAYTYTIFNSGDTAAHDVILENKFPNNSLNFHSGTPADKDKISGNSTWEIGTIDAGETKEITVHTSIVDSFGNDKKMPLPLSAKVYGNQPDANDEDNQDSLLLFVGEKDDDSEFPRKTFPAKFVIEKSADKSFATPGETVNYSIELTNRGGQLYDSLLVDVLRDSEGNVLNEQSWPLETVKNGEVITITYTINLPENIVAGEYTNTAQIVGLQGSTNKRYQTAYESPLAEHVLTIGEVDEQPLLGLSEITPTCSPYLSTYLRQGKQNDSGEVVKLQYFLKEYVTNNLIVTGVFDTPTKKAVKSFQEQYATDILEPWGTNQSSGYVYYTTQKKINEIMCDEQITFPLTQEQKNEIDLFKFQTSENNENQNNLHFGRATSSPDLADETTTAKPIATEENTDTISFQSTGAYDSLYDRMDNWLVIFDNKHTALNQ